MSRYFILFMILLQGSLIYAQDVQPVNTAKEVKELNKQINTLKKDNTKLNEDIRKLNADIQAKKIEIQKNKEAYEASANYAKIKELDSIIAARNAEINRLSNVINMQNDSIANHIGAEALEAELKQLEEESQALIEFATNTRKELFKKIDNMIQMSYLQIDMAEIEALIQECRPYANDGELSIKLSLLDGFRKTKKTIDDYAEVIYMPYNQSACLKAIKELKKQESFICTSKPNNPKPWTDRQWAEIEQVLIPTIELYPVAIQDFTKFFDQIYEIRKDWKYESAAMCEDEVKAAVEAFDASGIDNIKQIPYLYDKYLLYTKSIKKNAFNKDALAIEDEIRSYLPAEEPEQAPEPEKKAFQLPMDDETISIDYIENIFKPSDEPQGTPNDPTGAIDDPAANADDSAGNV